MSNISFIDRLKTIISLVFSQSFFIVLFFILLLTIALVIVSMKVKNKTPRYIIGILYAGLAVLVLARYGGYVFSLHDTFVDKFFKVVYFPNAVVYLSMLIISILLLAYVIIDNEFSLFTRICTFSFFFLIWFLTVLTLDTVKIEKLNFSEVTELYGNATTMVLLQSTMAIFLLWCFIVVVELVVRNLSKKMDSKAKENGKTLNEGVSLKDFTIFFGKLKKKKSNDEEVSDFIPNDPNNSN